MRSPNSTTARRGSTRPPPLEARPPESRLRHWQPAKSARRTSSTRGSSSGTPAMLRMRSAGLRRRPSSGQLTRRCTTGWAWPTRPKGIKPRRPEASGGISIWPPTASTQTAQPILSSRLGGSHGDAPRHPSPQASPGPHPAPGLAATIAANLSAVRSRIARAARTARRNPRRSGWSPFRKHSASSISGQPLRRARPNLARTGCRKPWRKPPYQPN